MGGFNLPIDVLRYIMQFLSECDRISLCLSKVSPQFTELYGRRRNLSLCLGTPITAHLLREIPACSVLREAVRSLNLSHCYFLPLDLLISTITQLEELEELYVHDTKFHLKHMDKIFQHCSNLTKLSTNLIVKHEESGQKTGEQSYVNILHPHENKFSQLTFLKLEIMNKAPKCFWPDLFQLLGWCQNCTTLKLAIYSTSLCMVEMRDQHGEGKAPSLPRSLFHKLKWMSQLNTLELIKRGFPEYRDLVIEQFLDWLFRNVTFTALEHVHINCAEENMPVNIRLPSTLKTLVANQPVHDFQRSCPDLVRVGCVKLSTLDQLIHLRDVSGVYCSDREFDDFVRLHPMIEHLYVKFNGAPYFPEAFQLPKLRSLTYESTLNSPDVDIMRTVVDACPNIEELYLSHSGTASSQVLSHLHRLKRLRKLVVNGDEYDVDVYRQIFTGCKRLQRLHISLHYDPSATGAFINLDQLMFLDLEADEPANGAAGPAANGGCLADSPDRAHILEPLFSLLPLATSLRELRLHVRVCLRVRLQEFLGALQHCHSLERLVIIKDEDRRSFQMIYYTNYSDHWDPLDADAVVGFVTSAQRLLALCLIDEYFSQSAIVDVSQRLKNEILPCRPAFWFHIGLQLPGCVDDTIPRIFYNRLIKPLDGYSIPYSN